LRVEQKVRKVLPNKANNLANTINDDKKQLALASKAITLMQV
jgi:hypothetical protein